MRDIINTQEDSIDIESILEELETTTQEIV